MDTLRAGLIRLAHSQPELRGDLLPLLKEASAPKAVDFVLESLQDYVMMFVVSLTRKHRDRAQEYHDLILTLKHDNPHIYQIIKAAWGRKARSMLEASQETLWMREFMKAFRNHMEKFLGYVVNKSTSGDRAEIADAISELLANPRWLLRTVEQGFDKGLSMAKAF